MRVLQVYKDYYPPVKGGIEKHINLLANALKYRGVGVDVLVSNDAPRLGIDYIDDIRIIKAPQISRLASAPLNFTFPWLLRKLAKEADIIHFHLPNPTAVMAYLFSGVRKPVVATYHSDIVRQKTLKKLYAPFSRRFLGKTDAIIATSPCYVLASEELVHYRRKCHVVPLGINLSQNNGSGGCPQQSHGIRSRYGGPIVLFVGKFRYYKGLKYLIDAMEQLDAVLLLVGSGPVERELQDYVNARRLQKKIVFVGEVPDQDIGAYYDASDVVVLPSVYKSEAFGTVLLEAMCRAKPVISTELGTGTSFVNIHNQTGIVVPPANAGALSRAIQRLLENSDLCARLGRAGRERVGQYFDHHKMVEGVMAIYAAIL